MALRQGDLIRFNWTVCLQGGGRGGGHAALGDLRLRREGQVKRRGAREEERNVMEVGGRAGPHTVYRLHTYLIILKYSLCQKCRPLDA